MMALNGRLANCSHFLCGVVFLGLSSCAEPPVADPALVEAEERRILSPFQVTQTIVADKLELVMSANFWFNLVEPATSPLYSVERKFQTDGGKDVVWSSPSAAPMRLFVDKTEFVITKKVHIKVLGGPADYQLSIVAAGRVYVATGGDRKKITEVVIENGSFRAR